MAYGAALAGGSPLAVETNLLRETGFKARTASTWGTATIALSGLVFFLTLAVLFTPYITTFLRFSGVEKELEVLRQPIERIEKIKKKTIELAGRKAQLERLGGGEHVVLELLKELAVKLPENTWLNEFSFDGEIIKIGGLSASSSPLISILEASPLLDKVEFSSSITVTDSSKGQSPNDFGLFGAGTSPKVQGKRLERFKIKAVLEGPA